MSLQSGVSWRLKRVSVGDYHLGGKQFSAEPTINPEQFIEVGTGDYQAEINKIAHVSPKISWSMKPQHLDDFVADYSHTNKFAFNSAEAAQVPYDLHTLNGLSGVKLGSCVTNSCKLTIPIRGAIQVMVESYAKNRTLQAYGSDPTPITDAVLTKANLETITIGGTSVKADFRSIEVAVNWKAEHIHLGTTIFPNEVRHKEAIYTVSIERGLKTQSFAEDAYNGTQKSVILQINDNRTTPKKTKFTFTNMDINVHSHRINELDITYERFECKGRLLTLAAGT